MSFLSTFLFPTLYSSGRATPGRATPGRAFRGRNAGPPTLCGVLLLLALLSAGSSLAQTIRYVKPTATGTGDGTSWTNASGNLQAMIDASAPGHQVWVAAGVYKPTTGNDRTISFRTKGGVALYGGFVGVEQALSERPAINPVAGNPSSTTLSGDLLGNDGPDFANNADNSYHVIYNDRTIWGAFAMLDGFVITGGNANGSGGAIISDSFLSLINCSLLGNTATNNGGAIYSDDDELSLTNCFLQDNKATNGGAIYSLIGNPILTNCIFQGNTASNAGGAIFIRPESTPSLTNCILQGNTATNFGGAILNGSRISLTNCSLLNNTARDGGAIYNFTSLSSSLTNCSLLNNTASNQGGAIYNRGSSSSLTNCVLWGNGGGNSFFNSTSDRNITARYSLFDNTNGVDVSGPGNLTTTTSPFADIATGTLSACSPAINAGDPTTTTTTVGTTDLAGNNRFVGDRIDMGAVEFQSAPGQPLAITQQPPSGQAICPGGNVTVPVSVTGTATGYQWFKDGNALANQTSATLQLTNVQASDAGSYQLTITGSCNSVTSMAFTLTINTPSPDYQPLVDLYNTTNGANWSHNSGWLQGCDPCTGNGGNPWSGVGCTNGRVTSLKLISNRLSGSLPASLGNLSNLQQLILTNNQLSGSIPESLGNLTNLLRLDLNENQLSGSIPASLGNLTNLQWFYLNENQLSGTIPTSLGSLANLQYLGLNNNQLSGSIPASLGSLTNLRQLFFHDNQLNGSIPESLGSLTNLLWLDLNNNQLSGSIPESLGSLNNLQFLILSGNQLSGSIPANLGNLTNLQGLEFNDNQLSGSVPASLGNLTNLQTLLLFNNQLSGCFPASLKALCGRTVAFSGNASLPGGGDFAAFCAMGAGGNDLAITSPPASGSAVCVGGSVSVPVSITGTATGYQWFKNGNPVAEQTSATLNLSNLQASDAGSYQLTISGSCGSITSTTFTLTVNPLPSVSISPSSAAVCAGQGTRLTASGGNTYKWNTGAEGNILELTNLTATATYSVTGVDGNGCSNSAQAEVTVTPTPAAPTLVSSSGSNQLYPGGLSTLTVPQYSGTVTLTLSGCPGGTLRWTGPGGSSGTGNSITLATTATGQFVYEATCQQGACMGPVATATVTVQTAALQMVAPLYDCASRKLTLRTTGGNGQSLEYQIASVSTGWESASSFTLESKHIGRELKLRARQRKTSGGYTEVEVSFTPIACTPGARRVADAAVAVETELRMLVAPNPVEQVLAVDVQGLTQPGQLRLLDVQGQWRGAWPVAPAVGGSQVRADVSSLPAGVYLLLVETPQGVLARQRVLKR